MIPSKFYVAGGRKILVEIVDHLEDDTTYLFGTFNDVTNVIKVAKRIKIDHERYDISEEDMERTFLHELGHCFQFYSGLSSDEIVAQAFSNFMWEYNNTKE